jgi:hypothetical protein
MGEALASPFPLSAMPARRTRLWQAGAMPYALTDSLKSYFVIWIQSVSLWMFPSGLTFP